jgi:sugar lactone lactonase YvrE
LVLLHGCTQLSEEYFKHASTNRLSTCIYDPSLKQTGRSGAVSVGPGGAFADGTGSLASFFTPTGVAVAKDGTVYVADSGNRRIRAVTPQGAVSTVAGSGTEGVDDGPATSATFTGPTGVAVGAGGELYVTDSSWQRRASLLRRVAAGFVTTLAGGNASAPLVDGAVAAAAFQYPGGLAVDAGSGDVFVGDSGNHAIRRVTPDGVVTTLAGGRFGAADGAGSVAEFAVPFGVAVAEGVLLVADQQNSAVRRVNAATGEVTTAAR